jgi:hypothetical protein
MRVGLGDRDGPPSRATHEARCRASGTAAASVRLLSLVVLLAFAGAGIGGCAFTRGDLGVPFKETDISAIRQGQSTVPYVVALLGAPDEIIRLGNDRQAFHYYHYAMKHATLLVFSRVNIASDQIYVFFDARGVVDRVVSGNRTDGLEFQFWPFDP